MDRGTVFLPDGSILTKPIIEEVEKGKINFTIAFVSPTHKMLGPLAEYGEELLSAFKIALEMMNIDSGSKIQMKALIYDEGSGSEDLCKSAAESIKKAGNVVAVVGGYRSKCSMNLHHMLGE